MSISVLNLCFKDMRELLTQACYVLYETLTADDWSWLLGSVTKTLRYVNLTTSRSHWRRAILIAVDFFATPSNFDPSSSASEEMARKAVFVFPGQGPATLEAARAQADFSAFVCAFWTSNALIYICSPAHTSSWRTTSLALRHIEAAQGHCTYGPRRRDHRTFGMDADTSMSVSIQRYDFPTRKARYAAPVDLSSRADYLTHLSAGRYVRGSNIRARNILALIDGGHCGAD